MTNFLVAFLPYLHTLSMTYLEFTDIIAELENVLHTLREYIEELAEHNNLVEISGDFELLSAWYSTKIMSDSKFSDLMDTDPKDAHCDY